LPLKLFDKKSFYLNSNLRHTSASQKIFVAWLQNQTKVGGFAWIALVFPCQGKCSLD
jgi:hypothetical protein